MTFTRLRRFLLTTLIVLALLSAIAGVWLVAAGYLANNSAATAPATSTLAASRDRAIEWLRNHEAEVLAADNPALWWMVREAAAQSGSPYLADLYGKYYDRHLAGNPGNMWHHLFDSDATGLIPVAALDAWPDYNLLFLYGLSCQHALRAEPRVAALLKADACGKVGTPTYFRDPACITHQLIGVRFMQDHQCENGEATRRLAGALIEQVLDGARWDFRVVDFYVQRLLMLAESGNADRIQARWLVRVLAAQRPDGGWDDFDELVGLGERSIGWSGRGLRLRKPESNFHTTAQGLYLMALLAQTSQGDRR